MKILILGGTSDGRKFAQQLHLACQQHQQKQKYTHTVIYSVAGLVRQPKVDCQVLSGGFRQRGGLRHYLLSESIDLLIDITHPYAQTMSNTAVLACEQVAIPCWRLHRLPWSEFGCQVFNDVPSMLNQLGDKKVVFSTLGQLSQSELQLFALYPEQKQLMRSAVPSPHTLPSSMSWQPAIGPFSLADELALLQDNKIDLLLTKNSGGNATSAKLTAAHQLGITIYMQRRPVLLAATRQFSCPEQLFATLLPALKQGELCTK